MSQCHTPDPTTPPLTFDSYVMPETLRAQSATSPGPRVRGAVLAVGVIAVLTFSLGVMVTLHFTDPRYEAAMAQVAPPPADDAFDEVVTRGISPDLMTVGGRQLHAELAPSKMSEILQGLTPRPTIGDMTLAEQAEQDKQNIVSRNKLRMLREGVLAGNYSVRVIERNGRQRLCLRMPNANVSQDEAAELIRHAAARGEIDLPESLSTGNGDFDADTLIFNLVQTSLIHDGTKEGAAAALEMSRRAFAASQAQALQIKGERTYLVEPGDSLAYISLQFYGQPSAYYRIFQANRALLKTPDKIQIGQRLIIPG